VVLGSVTRLSPLQAFISISVVDGVPLPAGEEFTGVIRTQDVRATEKDKVKIGDCFRGGDVVRGVVVRESLFRWAYSNLLFIIQISLGDPRTHVLFSFASHSISKHPMPGNSISISLPHSASILFARIRSLQQQLYACVKGLQTLVKGGPQGQPLAGVVPENDENDGESDSSSTSDGN